MNSVFLIQDSWMLAVPKDAGPAEAEEAGVETRRAGSQRDGYGRGGGDALQDTTGGTPCR
ncbi:hypothetical protein [Cryobacterium breve]|uniref:hypothetical protein n=1 Tax=Cryobacterium breve TaxID=1259258 RepID=UPI00248AC12A|nr:hypothetical protein [Cryobacterium breve]